MEIEELDLSVRAWSCLRRGGIYTVEDLTNNTYADLAKIRNMGRKCIEEIEGKLAEIGLKLRED